MSKVEKLIVDGNVAVVYSPGFGAAWSTWYSDDIAFDKEIAEIVMKMEHLITDDDQAEFNRLQDKIYRIAREKYDLSYLGQELTIAWIPQGKKFMIKEYDGHESVHLMEKMRFLEA